MQDEKNRQSVVVTGINMPFFSMAVFMVKWAIAAIPAFLILTVIGAFTWGILTGKKTEPSPSKDIEVPSSASTSGEATTPPVTESDYREKIIVMGVIVEPMTLGRKGVVGELKNTGNRALSDVEITIYCLDKNGSPIFEKLYHPVLASDVLFGSSSYPLKPGYSRRFEVIINDAPSEWSGKVEVKVTKVAFTEGQSGS
jgi:hypothetical protein